MKTIEREGSMKAIRWEVGVLEATEREVASMRAIVCRSAGRFDMLRLEEIEKPPVPDDGVVHVCPRRAQPVAGCRANCPRCGDRASQKTVYATFSSGT